MLSALITKADVNTAGAPSLGLLILPTTKCRPQLVELVLFALHGLERFALRDQVVGVYIDFTFAEMRVEVAYALMHGLCVFAQATTPYQQQGFAFDNGPQGRFGEDCAALGGSSGPGDDPLSEQLAIAWPVTDCVAPVYFCRMEKGFKKAIGFMDRLV